MSKETFKDEEANVMVDIKFNVNVSGFEKAILAAFIKYCDSNEADADGSNDLNLQGTISYKDFQESISYYIGEDVSIDEINFELEKLKASGKLSDSFGKGICLDFEDFTNKKGTTS